MSIFVFNTRNVIYAIAKFTTILVYDLYLFALQNQFLKMYPPFASTLITVFALALLQEPLLAVGQSSYGTTFAVAFPPMQRDRTGGFCSIIINSDQDADISITWINGSHSARVPSGSFYRYDVPCTQRTNGGVEQKVYYVTSDVDVTVTAGNNRDSEDELDATLVYPVRDGSKEFFLMMYVNPSGRRWFCGTPDKPGSFYIISAIDNDTEVSVYGPTGDLLSVVTLNQYECFSNTTTLADLEYDLTGTYISSSKPVAVSGGNACSQYTYFNFTEGGYTWSSMPPIGVLASGLHLSYDIYNPYSDPNNYLLVMVLATQNDTQVSLDGDVFLVQRGQSIQRQVLGRSIPITCSAPCLVLQVNNNYGDTSGIFMVHVPPVSSYNTFSQCSPLPTYINYTQYVRLMTPSPDYSSIRIEGLLTEDAWDCVSLEFACQYLGYFPDQYSPPARIYTDQPGVNFTGIAYVSGNVADGYGYNLGSKAN